MKGRSRDREREREGGEGCKRGEGRRVSLPALHVGHDSGHETLCQVLKGWSQVHLEADSDIYIGVPSPEKPIGDIDL